MASSVQETLNQINSTLKSSGSHYKGYSCKTVSWDDVQRGTLGGSLSSWGANITDTRLWAKDGRSLFTVRGDNWNERLGKVTADQIALVANADNQGRGTSLQPYTLRTFLKDPARFGGYAGLNVNQLSNMALDQEISVRFQTTFLPVGSDRLAALEFAPEAYNYNTLSDEDPRNLILLCTTQGLAVQQDGSGAKKLYHHAVQSNGTVHRHWLEAERSRHTVGGSQTETKEERDDALARGKATASVIGVAGMGTRFNALMTIQIPLKQKPVTNHRWSGSSGWSQPTEGFGGGGGYKCSMTNLYSGGPMACLGSEKGSEKGASKFPVLVKRRGGRQRSSQEGTSNAARVSKGSYVDAWTGLTVKEPDRHPSEHITVTIVMYYVCSGGVPTGADVKAAVDDLEEMYASLESGRLADSKFDFMKSELTVKDTKDIHTKLVTQPPPPKMGAVDNWAVFPTS